MKSIPRMLCENGYGENGCMLLMQQLDNKYFVQKYSLETSDGHFRLVNNYSTVDSKKAWAFYRKLMRATPASVTKCGSLVSK